MDRPENRGVGRVVQQLECLLDRGSLTGMTESQLLDRFAASRDELAFATLVERHGPMVLCVCRQFLHDPNDVDDAFQATFLVLVRKAGRLRQKNLLGNWLYGVACRVCLRSRAVAFRSRTRLTLMEHVQECPAGGAAEHDDPGAGRLLSDEERPLVHEEVNRLPLKYRTPIVLCYFEGLTHDQAAARLGWPLGTVKGRLARARDLLRSRLVRRGIAVSAAALSVHLAEADLRAAVPASLAHVTLRAAQAIAARGGTAIAASSAVSLSVASLTEGVLQTMILSQIKSIALPVLAAGTFLAAGASVAAFQFHPGPGRRANTPAADQPRGTPAGPESAKAIAEPAASGQALEEAAMARQILGDLKRLTIAGEQNDPESYHTWSLRLLEAEKRQHADNTPAELPPGAAYEGHLQRMQQMLKQAEALARSGSQSSYDVNRWRYFAKEAERMLDEVRTSSAGTTSGMMRNMMTGPMRGMMGGKMQNQMGGMMGGKAMGGSDVPNAGANGPGMMAANAPRPAQTQPAASGDAQKPGAGWAEPSAAAGPAERHDGRHRRRRVWRRVRG